MAAAGLTTLAACSDTPAPTEPRPRIPAAEAPLADGGNPNTPPPPYSLTATLGPGAVVDEGRVTPIALSGGSYAESTLVEIKVSGILSRTYSNFTYLWGTSAGQPAEPYDPAGVFKWGEYYDCQGQVYVEFTLGGLTFCDVGNQRALQSVWTATKVVKGTGRAGRYQGSTTNYRYLCGGPGRNPCYLYAGEQTVTVTPIADKLQLSADKSDVLTGDTVTFTARTADGSAFQVREWLWVSSSPPSARRSRTGSSAAPAQTAGPPSVRPSADAAGNCGTATVCRIAVYESGTMYVRALVAGHIEQAKAAVAVTAEALQLTANRSTAKPGEVVTFTAKTKHGSPFTVQQWRWQASSGPALTNPASCGTQQVCAIPVYEAGWMTVEATVQGLNGPQIASVPVSTQNCPLIEAPGMPYDSIINSPGVRKGLADGLIAGNINDLPQRGTRKEVGGRMFRRPDGAIIALPIPNIHPDSGCKYEPDPAFLPPAGWVPIPGSMWHDHPYGSGERIYGCADFPNGTRGLYPGPSGSAALPGQAPFGDVTRAITDRVAGYILDGYGNLYRHNFPPQPGGTPEANRIVQWKRDGASICFSEPSSTP
ncbi:MAG: hypothetical protein WKG32_11855 [Gemmatimonadaceae bacterium]